MIPATAHFVWLGSWFPWFNVLAIRSALERGGFSRVVLHHDEALAASALGPLLADPRVHFRPIDLEALCAGAGVAPAPFAALMSELTAPSARSNVLRCLALAAEGGVYLDTDTVTVKSLDDLRASGGAFCGQERVARPLRWIQKRRAADQLKSWALLGLRQAFRLWPRGYLHFRMVEGLYPLAVNNAVLGCAARHPFMLELLARMVKVPPARRRVRFALGTHLLQRHVADYAGAGLVVYPPEYFYPLAPEIADHWFRHHARHDLDQVLSPQTRIVHWYGSTHRRRTMVRLAPDYVLANARRQMLSQLAAPFVTEA